MTAGPDVDGNPYGFVDAAAREYVIRRPDTPTPWLNYLGQGRYGGIVSNTGGGFSFDADPRNRRVTRYRYNGIPADQPGRYVYLRDTETGRYWSPTWQPVRRDLDRYECRHGPGYTRIRGTLDGIESELLYFVPPGGDPDVPCELWMLRVRNAGARPRSLRTFTYAEFGFVDAVSDQQNLDWSQHIVGSRLDDGVILVSTRFRPTTSFFAASLPASGFTGDRDAFVGRGRDLANPWVVESGTPTNAGSPRGNSLGSLCHDLELGPGQERQVVYMLGVTDRPAGIAACVARFREPGAAEADFDALRADWDRYLGHVTVETPDDEANEMLNVWNQVQCRTTLHWSRFVSGYETGLGRGIGTRDSAQDTLGVLHAAPDRARDLLGRVWAMQFADGHAWHQFFPLTGEGGSGLAAERPEWPQWFSDDHLWLVLATCAYLRETGDLAFLDEPVAWADGGEAPVWTHALRAVDFTLGHLGPHGLPRAGYADWDDTLNVDHGSGLAESTWCGMLFCRVMTDLAEVCAHTGRGAAADRFEALRDEMAAALNRCGWDGAWYARAFDDDGRPIGVAAEDRHRINMNPQTWSVIGGVATAERAALAMRSMDERLSTPLGIAMLWPPYDGLDTRVSGTSTFPPGAKENGGIFCHANAWAVVAAAMLGHGDDAYRYYRQFLPLARTDADRFGAEPYVYPQNICGPTHPQFGLARNAWLTGTAAWTYVAATHWILGIRPGFDGLRVSPVLPSTWSGYRARREFRGVTYAIEVTREGPGTECTLEVDGRPLAGHTVPLPPPGTTHVSVRLTLR